MTQLYEAWDTVMAGPEQVPALLTLLRQLRPAAPPADASADGSDPVELYFSDCVREMGDMWGEEVRRVTAPVYAARLLAHTSHTSWLRCVHALRVAESLGEPSVRRLAALLQLTTEHERHLTRIVQQQRHSHNIPATA